MAPKKKPQKQHSKSTSKTNKQQSSSGPSLQISAENENRLRRLLLNSGRIAPTAVNPAQDTLSKAQKAKKLKAVYEKLSCEGFSNDQIELALSSLKDGATFEAALDWLCLNLLSNELPSKFSSGTSLHPIGSGSVSVISTAQDNWTPSVDPLSKINGDAHEISVRIKRQLDEDTLDSCQPSQADWIRQYLEQQEEDESKSWDDEAVYNRPNKEVPGPRSLDVIAKEYYAARSEATKAKDKGDKKSQEQAGHIIRKLKQELSALGLSDEILASKFGGEHASASALEDTFTSSTPFDHHESITFGDVESDSALVVHSDEPTNEGHNLQSSSSEELQSKPLHLSVPVQEKISLDDVSGDVELGDFFLEDAPSNEALPPEVLELQKKEKMKKVYSEKNLEKLDEIWKKGDQQKIPKAVLHQLCQRSGWEAPKFNKLNGKENSFSYAVSVLRKASGRGKSRKAGGLITLQLPNQDETFKSTEDAQNRVAAFALHHLFPDLPIHLVILEPYASLVLQWNEGESSTKIEDSEEDRRAGFVDWLLNADCFSSIASANVTSSSLPEAFKESHVEEIKKSSFTSANQIAGRYYTVEAESSFLRREQENKKRMQIYKDMLKTRAALPIAGLKGDILQLLKENNVLVVCGETGSGKTTQVPQFILDDMIESGNGGYCNIICTQPRRIAAISVAARVAVERCEPSPGSNGSLVGYQVRLDSARNEKTKLLFCTTGILLRKLAVYYTAWKARN